MMLLRKQDREKLLANGRNPDQDHSPVVKFFNPCGSQTWLFSELSEDGEMLFGLCDLGMGCTELGDVPLAELESFKGMLGIGIERDRGFRTDLPMSQFCEWGRRDGRISA